MPEQVTTDRINLVDELRAEITADRADLDDARAELLELRSQLSLLAVALGVDEVKAAADPSTLTARANLVCGQLLMHVKTIARIRHSHDRDVESALRVLDHGLAALETK